MILMYFFSVQEFPEISLFSAHY